jgi:hypothetical protein
MLLSGAGPFYLSGELKSYLKKTWLEKPKSYPIADNQKYICKCIRVVEFNGTSQKIILFLPKK